VSFTRVNPLGWALFEELTSAQMNALDIDHANALDAVGGGAHVTANPLSVSGAKWTFSNPIDFSNSSIGWTGANWPALSTRSLTYKQPLAPFRNELDYFDLDGFSGGGTGWMVQTSIAGTGGVGLAIVNRPAMGTITRIFASVIGDKDAGSAHAGGLPSTMPRLIAYHHNAQIASWTQLFNVVDPSASPGAYDGVHVIEQTGLSIAFNEEDVFYLKFAGEFGTNAIANKFAVRSIGVNIDVTQIGA